MAFRYRHLKAKKRRKHGRRPPRPLETCICCWTKARVSPEKICLDCIKFHGPNVYDVALKSVHKRFQTRMAQAAVHTRTKREIPPETASINGYVAAQCLTTALQGSE